MPILLGSFLLGTSVQTSFAIFDAFYPHDAHGLREEILELESDLQAVLDDLECDLPVQGTQERILVQAQIQELPGLGLGNLEGNLLEGKEKGTLVLAYQAFLELGILALGVGKILGEMFREQELGKEEGLLQMEGVQSQQVEGNHH